jgi:hypothetical protein
MARTVSQHDLRIERMQGRRSGRGTITVLRAACAPCDWRGRWVVKQSSVERHAVAHVNEGSHRAD